MKRPLQRVLLHSQSIHQTPTKIAENWLEGVSLRDIFMIDLKTIFPPFSDKNPIEKGVTGMIPSFKTTPRNHAYEVYSHVLQLTSFVQDLGHTIVDLRGNKMTFGYFDFQVIYKYREGLLNKIYIRFRKDLEPSKSAQIVSKLSYYSKNMGFEIMVCEPYSKANHYEDILDYNFKIYL